MYHILRKVEFGKALQHKVQTRFSEILGKASLRIEITEGGFSIMGSSHFVAKCRLVCT